VTKKQLEAVNAELRAQLTAGPGKALRCAFCGECYPAGTPDFKHASLEAHIRVCTSHPIGIENRELIKALNIAKEAMEEHHVFDGRVALAWTKFCKPKLII
jgi:hypothetical protein